MVQGQRVESWRKRLGFGLGLGFRAGEWGEQRRAYIVQRLQFLPHEGSEGSEDGGVVLIFLHALGQPRLTTPDLK